MNKVYMLIYRKRGDIMKYTLKKKVQKPFLHSNNDIIIEVNKEFIDFIGYSKNELIGKSLAEISCMLRIATGIKLKNIEKDLSCYIFTKTWEAREVTISCKGLEDENEKIYFFKEKPNSRPEERLMFANQLCKDNKTGIALWSFPDLILLSVNQKFLDFLDAPYNKKENCIGRSEKEIVTEFQESCVKDIWSKVTKTGKSYYAKEAMYEHLKRGITYWDLSIVPILMEGEPKFIVQITSDVTGRAISRKLIEEQSKIIEQQKNQLEAIIENISDEVFIVHKDGSVVPVNEAARKTLHKLDTKRSMGEAYKKITYYDLEGNIISFEELPSIAAFRGKVIKNKRILVKMPYKEIIAEVSSSPIFNKEGQVSMAVTCMHDITDLVQKEKIIKQQKEELEAIIDNMSDSLLIFDKDGNYTTFNKSARDNLFIQCVNMNKIGDGLKQAEYFDMNQQLISPENIPARRVLKGEKLLGYRMSVKTDHGVIYTDVSGTPIYDNEGKLIAGILCCRDVTERIKSEKDALIKAQYDFLNRMIDNLDLPVLTLSYPDFKITDINQKAYNFLKGLKPEINSMFFAKKLKYSDIIANFDKVQMLRHIQDIIEKKEVSYLKYKKLVVFGKEMFVNVLHQPVFGLNSEIVAMVAIVIDVTEEIKAKHHMEKNLKMQEEFFANISHELKTPLNIIFSTAQLFELYLKTNSLMENKDNIIKKISIIRQNCYRLTKLISNIVDLSKIESGFFQLNLSNENIVDVVENIVQSVSEYVKSKGLSITFDTNTEEKIIACDPNKIERIILNLISNAVKFSEPEDEIYVEILDKNHVVEISVKDNGIGIDKEHLDSIFERFKQVDKSFTRNAEGSGIGLCLVKSIVKLHGGKIKVESKLGQGSKFIIELPSKTIEKSKKDNENKMLNSNVEMINVEFSDIYL